MTKRASLAGHLFVAALALLGSPGCGSSGDRPSGTGGAADGGNSVAPCELTVSKDEVSAQIPTVGVVEWSLAGEPPSSATIVYRLTNADTSLLNQGGEAPVALGNANYRTLLLGLKQSKDYTFRIEATRGGQTCVSSDYALPTTGSFTNPPNVTVSVAQAAKREPGFIVTSSGTFVPDSAFIIDADGEIVWFFPGPIDTTRAQMDYEGNNMWMIALNLENEGGEMRYVSMDGAQSYLNVAGLEFAHHDFTVMPGGKVAALVWSVPGNDPPSDLVIRSPDGTVSTPFTIGSNLYLSDTFHANAIHYLPSDDSFTIADRNPNLVVKVSATGAPVWQLGGVCDGAPTGNHCSPQPWQVNHGHQLLPDGTLLVFNNTDTYGVAHVLEFQLEDTATALSATPVGDYLGTAASATLGDVQRLPGGNTLVTYSNAAEIVELDPSWNEVQTFSAHVGYSSWRPTLYGPPLRL